MKIKIECEIEIDENTWCRYSDQEEMEWFKSLLDDKNNEPMVILWSNEVGDTIGETFNFKYKIL